MEKNQIEYLKQQHDFNAWCGCNSLKEGLFIWNYFLSGIELNGWQIQANQELMLAEGLRCIQATWQGQEGNVGAALRVDVYECASRLMAHQYLLQLLGQFQLPGVERQKEIEIGDVAFASYGDSGILFARANCVFFLSNAERKLVSASDIARPFDKQLYREPTVSPKSRPAPKIGQFKTSKSEAGVGEIVTIEIKASAISRKEISAPDRERMERPASARRSPMYKFFSSSGEVLLEQGRPVYKAEAKGHQKITVFAVDADHGVGRQACQLNIK